MVLDPSGFTLPYDFLLLRGLGRSLERVTFLTRRPRQRPAEHYPELDNVEIVTSFYPLAEGLRKRIDKAAVYGPVKVVEHFFGLRAAARLATREAVDVVHLQWLVLPQLDRRFVRRLQASGIPVIHTVHDTKPFHGSPTAAVQVNGWLETLQCFDALIVHTTQSRNALRELGVEGDRIHVIPHGIIPLGDGPPPAPVPRQFGEDDPVTLLFFGLIKPYKGVDVLLEAFAKISPEFRRGVRLKIAGNPIEVHEDLTDVVARLGIQDQVDLDLRFVPDNEVPALVAGADVLVFPYHRIDASGIFMSILPYGKPIVASNVGLFQEYVNSGTDGLLPAPGDVDELALALTTLLSDRARLTAMTASAAGRARSVPDWDEIGAQTAELYARLASQ